VPAGGEQIECADARGHERLVRVSESRVGNEQALFLFRAQAANFFGPSFLQELPRAGRGFAGRRCRDNCCFEFFGDLLPFYFGIAV